MLVLLGLLFAAFVQVAHTATIPANLHLDDSTVNAKTGYVFQIQPAKLLKVDYLI